jgi:ribosome-binding protein aMBF1 (putative translation factor)
MKRDQHAEYVQERMNRSGRYRRAHARYSRQVDLAMLVHQMREAARFTQAELAERAGTTQSAIARLEDAEYTAHSLQTIEKIAEACGVTLTLRAAKKPKLELVVSLA